VRVDIIHIAWEYQPVYPGNNWFVGELIFHLMICSIQQPSWTFFVSDAVPCQNDCNICIRCNLFNDLWSWEMSFSLSWCVLKI